MTKIRRYSPKSIQSVDSMFMITIQFMHDYMYWHYSMDCCVKLILVKFCNKIFLSALFHAKMISTKFLNGINGELQIDAKRSHSFKHF